MKRIIATGAVAALAMVGFAGTASAEPMGNAYGKQIKDLNLLGPDANGSYGQLLNFVRDNPHPSGTDVFPPAAGAKAFYEIHTAS